MDLDRAAVGSGFGGKEIEQHRWSLTAKAKRLIKAADASDVLLRPLHPSYDDDDDV